MINLFDIIAQSQQGAGLQTLAQQYGLTMEQTRRATEALLPAFSVGLNRATQSPDAFQGFMQQMANFGVNPGYFDQPQSAFTPQGMMNGNALLEMMFGNKDVSRAVTQQAALTTGIGESILKAMLPTIASMVLGGLFKGFGQAPAPQPQPQAGPGGDIFGEIIRNMTGQGTPPQPTPQPQASPGGDIFGEIIRNMTGQGAPPQSAPGQPQSPQIPGMPDLGPWGSILGSILGGMTGAPQAPGRPSPEEDYDERPRRADPRYDPRQAQDPYGHEEEPEGEYEDDPRRPDPRQAEPQDTRPRDIGDIFGQIFGTGRQIQDNQLQDLNDIFDKFTKGQR